MTEAVDPAFTTANAFVDSDHPSIVAFARAHLRGTPRDSAVALFDAVRDRLRYTPWNVHFEPEQYRASRILAREPAVGGHCIDKALLLAAACRALGIPARMHYADVRNHIGTASLEATLGTDLLVFHGYAELFLGGRWVAATPAFNTELCVRLGVAPLTFDGVHDAVFQEYAGDGRFMEYVRDRGHHAGVPLDDMFAAWREHYPPVRSGVWPTPG